MDVAKTMAFDDWKRSIISKFNMSAGKSKEDAKLSFLKVIYRWPTYGSAFFEIQQHTDSSLPENLIETFQIRVALRKERNKNLSII